MDKEWSYRRGFIDSIGMLDSVKGVTVNLPHDGMISKEVTKDSDAISDYGYFPGDVCNYTKNVLIPKSWENECIGLLFDGAMMHVSVEVNGCKAFEHHYGYTPFFADITDYVYFGEENRITINMNTGVLPSSRWYTGSGLFRGVELCHGPKVHIPTDGIYLYTKEVSGGRAFLEAKIDVTNSSYENRLAEVSIVLSDEKTGNECGKTKRVIQINSRKSEIARMSFTVENPVLWDAENPNLYTVKVCVKDLGVYKTHFIKNTIETIDEAETIFGIRTITADAIRGLCINGKTVKLKGGCLHHDNGLLGAVSLYESEARKVLKLKEVGFNAIRTAHNPPSRALVEACDRVGMYIFDEAFDAWTIAKRTGDYSQYFSTQWEKDLSSFVKRDRIHPSVIMWSTGNEIPERGGMSNGYSLATKLVDTIKSFDTSRPVSHGICSLWSGLDDYLAKGQNQNQNANDDSDTDKWEKITEPFTNGLDVVGYNYMEDIYERDHELFPDRVILGSENFPQQIGYRWPLVESLPYVIGDFTWTAWDYIGEAGIGKAVYVDADDPVVSDTWSLMPSGGSPYPWRLANDADFDITGRMLPQGAYRSVVWGSKKTYLFSYHPDYFGKTEIMTMWGFPGVEKNWNYVNHIGKPMELVVYSNADEVAIVINGSEVARKPVSMERPMPNSARFEVTFEPGTVEAISYKDGYAVSKDEIKTAGAPAKICVTPEKLKLKADGHDVSYVNIDIYDENGVLVPDGSVELTATLTGVGCLSGFGTGNPKTEENYTDNKTVTFRGHATAIVRSGYEKGASVLKIEAKGLNSVECMLGIE